MNFLSKIEAIHPRGAKTKTKVERKKLSSQPKGNSFVSKLDWLASMLKQIIGDFNYSPQTNKLFHKVASAHSFITNSMDQKSKLKSFITFLDNVDLAGKELQRLYGRGDLSQEIDRKLLHKFLGEIAEISKKREGISELLQKMQQFEKEINNLGMGDL